MILPKDKQKEFEEITRPVIKWLNDNCHPHVVAHVDTTSAELFEGVCSTGKIMDYVTDCNITSRITSGPGKLQKAAELLPV